MTDFASEVLEVLTDVVHLAGTDPAHPSFARMEDALNASTGLSLRALQDAVEYEATQLADGLEVPIDDPAVLAAVFTWGVIAGREHARRGYTL